MSGKEGFQLVVETKTYKDGIITRDAGVVNEHTGYGLEKLSEALYMSAAECAKRHGKLEILNSGKGMK
jgi:hypothetical protein